MSDEPQAPRKEYRLLSQKEVDEGVFEEGDEVTISVSGPWGKVYVLGAPVCHLVREGMYSYARRPLKEGETAPPEVRVDPGTPEAGDHHAEHILAGPYDTSPAAVMERAQELPPENTEAREAREVADMIADEREQRRREAEEAEARGQKGYLERLRDEFAMHAIYEASQYVGGEREPSAIARRAYRIADAMLKERQPKPKEEEIPF